MNFWCPGKTSFTKKVSDETMHLVDYGERTEKEILGNVLTASQVWSGSRRVAAILGRIKKLSEAVCGVNRKS